MTRANFQWKSDTNWTTRRYGSPLVRIWRPGLREPHIKVRLSTSNSTNLTLTHEAITLGEGYMVEQFLKI